MSDLAVLSTKSSFRQWRESFEDEPVMFVPTMGALHQGHIELINAARVWLKTHADSKGKIVVSIFVNPTQFTESQDFQNYPKTLDQDLEICTQSGVDVVFAPAPTEVYPEGLENVTLLDPGPKANGLESDNRPNHFAGVVTVLKRLFDLVQPKVAFFGEKDYQQLLVVTDFFRASNPDLLIRPVPTVREIDGIALSSRNRRLSITGRATAKHIPAAIALAEHALTEGHSIGEVTEHVSNYLQSQPGITLEYFEIRNEDLTEVQEPGPGRILRAVKIQNVRLIDNVAVEIGDENVTRD